MHTPGPWKAEPFKTPDKDDDPMMVYIVNAGDLQTRYDNIPMDDEGEYDEAITNAIHAENRANARLIAAAPDLLEAAKAAYVFFMFISGNPALESTLKSVIAKAEGRTKP